jgi:RNA polymerase sigma-70 factor (ECF subfamily)
LRALIAAIVNPASPYHDQNDDVFQQLFNELFREHEQKLYVFVVKVLRSDAQAQDIVQDVFLKLWTIREQLHEIENMDAFLYRLTENKVYDHLRAAATREKTRQELWQRIRNAGDTTPDLLETKEYHTLIQQAIHQLSPQRKTIYLLSKQEGLKQQQIAAALQISPHTVRNHLAEAFRSIRNYVKKNLQSFLSL